MKFLHQWFCFAKKWLYNIGELFRGWNKDGANASRTVMYGPRILNGTKAM